MSYNLNSKVTVNSTKMIHSFSHSEDISVETYIHSIVNPLRRDRNIDSTLRNFLIRAVYNKAYPNIKRTTIKIRPWSDTPLLIKIDSHAKHCIACGNHAYYISYFVLTRTCKLAWRLCWKHLSDYDREGIIDYYTAVAN